MKKYAFCIILFVFSGIADAADWRLVTSADGLWIKTSNKHQHELLLAYYRSQPHFLLILSTDRTPPEDDIAVSIRIDKSPMESSKLEMLEKRGNKIIFRIRLNKHQKENIISQMIAGLKLSIYFDRESDDRKAVSFSLRGFTVAFNELLIGNEIGSLDPPWLIKHRKDRELYCLLTTNISIQAMQYRITGKSYGETLHLIPQTHYSVIDNHLAEIIRQVYDIPQSRLPYEPRAEKYLLFSRCMKHWKSRSQ